MQIQLNLAIAPSARERYALAWAVPVSLGAVALMVYFSLGAAHSFSNYRKYHRSLLELKSQEARWGASARKLREELNQPQPQKAFRVAKFVNTLIDKREFSLAELMEKVTKLLPPAVRLDAFAFSPEAADSLVRLSVVGKTQDEAEKFVSNLEDSSDFRDVIVQNQGSTGKGGEVSVSCSAVYAGGAPQ